MMIFSEIFEKAALLNFFAPEVSSTDDSFLKADAFKPFAAYRRRTTQQLLLKAALLNSYAPVRGRQFF